jgi:hypothetical protein
MSKDKHTPGPWRVAGRDTRLLPCSLVGANTLVANVYSTHYGDIEQETANAKLIAAAPDMLTALRVARRELHACQSVIHLRGGFDPAYVDDALRALQGIDAILAIATE